MKVNVKFQTDIIRFPFYKCHPLEWLVGPNVMAQNSSVTDGGFCV